MTGEVLGQHLQNLSSTSLYIRILGHAVIWLNVLVLLGSFLVYEQVFKFLSLLSYGHSEGKNHLLQVNLMIDLSQ